MIVAAGLLDCDAAALGTVIVLAGWCGTGRSAAGFWVGCGAGIAGTLGFGALVGCSCSRAGCSGCGRSTGRSLVGAGTALAAAETSGAVSCWAGALDAAVGLATALGWPALVDEALVVGEAAGELLDGLEFVTLGFDAGVPVWTTTVGLGGSSLPLSLSSIEPITTPAVATPATPATLKPTVHAVAVDAAAAALAIEFAANCWLKALGCCSMAFSCSNIFGISPHLLPC